MAFEQLKSKQSVIWGNGPYERISDHLTIAHDHLLRVVAPEKGERWLDLATGTGEIACRAAAAGADTTGLDLAPELIERARRRAVKDGVEVTFDVGDAESLPYDDGSFHTVSSSFGVMFAPDQEAIASELARVCRPAGRVGLITWAPEGGVADLFAAMKPFMPTPPEGAGNPFQWGDRARVDALLGPHFELSYEQGNCPQPGGSAEEVYELFATSYGPTKTLTESLDEERRGELRAACVEVFAPHRRNGGVEVPREYLVVSGIRR